MWGGSIGGSCALGVTCRCACGQYQQLKANTVIGLAQGERSSAALLVRNETDPEGPGSRGLYSLFWRLQGDACAVRTGLQELVRGAPCC